jgi:small subunit ribosomal protein S1
VTNVTEFGVFVELEEGIEGLVHVSEIGKEKIKSPVGKFQVGDVVTAKVLNLNPKERRIGLSMKQLEVDEEHELVTDYLNNYEGPTSSLGELLKENLQEKPVSSEPETEPLEEEADVSEPEESASEAAAPSESDAGETEPSGSDAEMETTSEEAKAEEGQETETEPPAGEENADRDEETNV